MTHCNVYIGRLSDGADPLDWGRDPNVGNVPTGLPGTHFPPNSHKAFFLLLGKIKNRQLPGKQVDWGGWAANVSKNEIIAFIDEVYRGDRTYTDPDFLPRLYPKLRKFLAVIRALPDAERFALVAYEI